MSKKYAVQFELPKRTLNKLKLVRDLHGYSCTGEVLREAVRDFLKKHKV